MQKTQMTMEKELVKSYRPPSLYGRGWEGAAARGAGNEATRPKQEHGVRYVHSELTVVKERSCWAEPLRRRGLRGVGCGGEGQLPFSLPSPPQPSG
ncbi:hypothetical protein E2C01_086279 [Portunus trituberculatus]|uniref:Uncharacterized protein n=1 Tax=Portunus trituberculatus TaxID=210409 RepID=A0A5B7J989_PORTR|nr:hypothetical protein [Portunus trituberculatus]